MTQIRFISDTHFYHNNMAIKRGFADAESMNEHIIEEWNKIVNNKDITYILGDITMEKSNYEIINRLNGIKKVVLGNHDKPQHVSKLLKYVNSVCGAAFLVTIKHSFDIIEYSGTQEEDNWGNIIIKK